MRVTVRPAFSRGSCILWSRPSKKSYLPDLCAYLSLSLGSCAHIVIATKGMVTTAIGLRFDRRLTPVRLLMQRYDLSTMYVTTRRPISVLAAALWPKQAVREAATICPRPCKLTFDLLTLKVVFESRVTWATSVPIF